MVAERNAYVYTWGSLVRNALAVAQRFRVLGLGIHLVGDGRSTSCAGSWQSTRVGGQGLFLTEAGKMFTQIRLLVPSSKRRPPETTHGGHRTQL